ncbi:MAG: trypsin-like peptidase domain-containing protein, partial [Acidobacteriaceae bacterium]|nr:trypsin-like peptidase domain-containing protein [Acidobacteriaceae bacterium]
MPIPVPGRVAEALRRSTVQIQVGMGRVRGNGSGIVIAPEQVITNAHVVRGPSMTVESWEGKSFSTSVLKTDIRRDLALLAAPGLDAPLASLGDSSTLKPGTPVVAIGNPLGFVGAVSSGIVHSISSSHSNGMEWIAADLQLAPGNSGGPLADFKGQVVGINTMIAAGGLAFAIPSRAVLRFLKSAPVSRSLGVVIRPVELPGNQPGMLVLELVPGGAAEAASLLPGDVLITANGNRLRYPEDLMTAIEDAPDGLLRLEFRRGGPGTLRKVTARMQ